MHIIHPINDFLFELFPKAKEAGNNIELLKQEIEKFYTVGPFKPAITIVHGIIDIMIEGDLIEKHNSRFNKVLALCDAREYDQARQQITQLIKEAPHISEYHRILGQILSEQDNQDDAINSMIDALRWDPKNKWALIMTGNILARYQHDIDAAMKYYECALQHQPDDYVALTLIGINLFQSGKTDEALEYLNKSLKLNRDYPNTHYAFAMLAAADNNFKDAFEMAFVALLKNPRKDLLYQQSLKIAMKSANALLDAEKGDAIVSAFAFGLEKEFGKEIVIEQDASLKTAAKIEFAENYDRAYHLVKYNPEYPAVQHLIMHELSHLRLAAQARQNGNNKLFVSDDENKKRFLLSLAKDARKLSKKGYEDTVIKEYYTLLFKGLNGQIFNTPIDLFIEDYLFENFPELRPLQFLSLYGLIEEGIKATTDANILTIAPSAILSKSKIFNLVTARHYQNLYGVNLVDEHNPTSAEQNQAVQLYHEYEEYRADPQPGDEYTLLQNWANRLYLQHYFSLIEESDFRSHSDLVHRLCAQEQIDMPENDHATQADQGMQAFTEAYQGKDINIAVTMCMVEALHYFKNRSDSEINEIAMQIALKCGDGISPDAEGYTVPLIVGKTFTGHQLLAFYYVSWAKAFPEYLDQLQLPFDKEYDLALEMVKVGGV